MMEFPARFTQQDLEEIARLTRPRFHWVDFVITHVHGVAFAVALTWIGVLTLLGRTHLPWWFIATLWSVVVGLVGWGFYAARRAHNWALARIKASLPDRTTLAADGVHWIGPLGAIGFRPWSQFMFFRERGGVLALYETKRTIGVFVSIRELSDDARRQLRDFLIARIPPPESRVPTTQP